MTENVDIRIKWGVAAICKGSKTDGFLLELLNSLGGYAQNIRMRQICGQSAIDRLKREAQIFSIELSLKRGTGATGKKVKGNIKNYRWWSIFKKEFDNKSFICNSRTSFLRLLFDALNPPQTTKKQCILTAWLNRVCTEAERMAVMWHLGIRSFSNSMRKRNIQIDGDIVKPILRREKR